jgi:hypothetical protein
VTRDVDTVIVGGGIAGLACARALHLGGRPFLLLTDRVGGRMHVSAEGHNLGAAYVTTDYRHVLRFVDCGPRIYSKDVYFFDGSRCRTVLHPSSLRHAAALGRLYREVLRFRSHLVRLRQAAPHRCQRELMRADPVLARSVEQPAVDFVREHGLEQLTEIYCGPIFFSTLFVPWRHANAFYFLANLMPILLPVYVADLRHTVQRLMAGFEARVVRQRVTATHHEGDGFAVHTATASYHARHLVLAVPERNARPLLALDTAAPLDVPYCTLHVRGQRRPRYRPGKTVFLRESHAARVLWPQSGGLDILYCASLDPDLSEYYEQVEIVDAVRWKTAVQLRFGDWRPLSPQPRLFTIGDYNICGLEDSFLTGLYAANQIMAERSHSRSF